MNVLRKIKLLFFELSLDLTQFSICHRDLPFSTDNKWPVFAYHLKPASPLICPLSVIMFFTVFCLPESIADHLNPWQCCSTVPAADPTQCRQLTLATTCSFRCQNQLVPRSYRPLSRVFWPRNHWLSHPLSARIDAPSVAVSSLDSLWFWSLATAFPDCNCFRLHYSIK